MRPQPPALLRFLAVNAALGVGLGWAALALLIATDTAGLGTLIGGSSSPILPLAMLAAVFGVTFGAAVMGTAVLSMPRPRTGSSVVDHDPERDRPSRGRDDEPDPR
ncbi:MAG: hypothetical protein AAFR16_06535 [Pseudomonadota bacterium]